MVVGVNCGKGLSKLKLMSGYIYVVGHQNSAQPRQSLLTCIWEPLLHYSYYTSFI